MDNYRDTLVKIEYPQFYKVVSYNEDGNIVYICDWTYTMPAGWSRDSIHYYYSGAKADSAHTFYGGAGGSLFRRKQDVEVISTYYAYDSNGNPNTQIEICKFRDRRPREKIRWTYSYYPDGLLKETLRERWVKEDEWKKEYLNEYEYK